MPTKLDLVTENTNLRRRLTQLEAEFRDCARGHDKLERELVWIKQQFEFLLRALQDFGWPKMIKVHADLTAKTTDALIRNTAERHENPVR